MVRNSFFFYWLNTPDYRRHPSCTAPRPFNYIAGGLRKNEAAEIVNRVSATKYLATLPLFHLVVPLLYVREFSRRPTLLLPPIEPRQTAAIEMEGATKTSINSYILRNHRPGDIGWIIHRHGVLYNQEYGWDERFESLVASICSDFINSYDPKLERCWIAEHDGEFLGSVMLVKDASSDNNVAKLRLLLVEPSSRGLGLGQALIQRCTQFARDVGYARIILWTNSVLISARRLYEREGYKLVKSEEHDTIGIKLVGEFWELRL